ncbi:hypothetical protein NC651_018242 [Populus alba x Populus x berolinensis]|nr:hypothetical protein NC651_018242 [Populus alba x Populus x berolinensis]
MANKKKRSGPSKYQLKRQKSLAASQLVNNSAILALGARSSSGTVHGTVPPISNSDLSPPMVSPLQSPCSSQPIPSSSHGSEPQHHGDSPSINHVFVANWSEDEDADPDDEDLEYDSAEEEYAGGSKFFTSPVNATPLFPVASASVDLPPTVLSPASPQATAISAPKDTTLPSTQAYFPTSESPTLVVPPAPAISSPVGTVNGVSAAQHNPLVTIVSETLALVVPPTPATSPPVDPVNGVSAAQHNPLVTTLSHYSAFTETSGCDLVGDDLDVKCDFWKLCLIGYVAGRSPGFKALQNVIVNSWKCEASLIMHESGWLIYKFATDADKLSILAGGRYLVYGRPLILRPMPAFFDFSSSIMHTVPVWVKFPNLPLQCWSLKCLSKIASVLGKPVQSDMLTHTMSRLSYARVLVEVNLLYDLPYSIDINLPNGSLLKQQVIYETLPWFYKQCRILGHLTSTCPKSVPWTDHSKQAAKVSAPAPSANTVKESVFDRLGPQEDPPVVVSPVGNLHLNSTLLLAEPELVAVSGAVDHVSGGWNIVQSKRIRRKNSPSKHRGRPSIIDHCSVHESSPVHAPVHASAASRDHRLPTHPAPNTNVLAGSRKDKGSVHESSPVHGSAASRDHHLPTHPAPNTNVLAGSRKDKGKAIFVSVDPGLPSAGVSSAPLRRRGAQPRTAQGLHVLISSLVHQFKFYSSFVYGFNTIIARRTLWDDLRNWSPNSPRLILGDFNSLLSQSYKHRGELVSTYETSDFRQCCSDLGLSDLNYYGSHFTWSNGSVWSKLDRVLANPLCSLSYTSVQVHFDNPGAFSDHSPTTISFHPHQPMGKKCFKFFNMWSNHSCFLDLVREAWQLVTHGSPMFTLCKRLKHLKRPLRDLNKFHFSHISERVARAEVALDEHQSLLSSDMDNSNLQAIDNQLRQSLLHIK